MFFPVIGRSIAFALACLLAASAVGALFFITVAISDAGWWIRQYEGRAMGEITSMLEFAAPLLSVGLVGTFLLRGFYKRHPGFAGVIGLIASFIMACVGVITISIASGSEPRRALFLAASIIYGILVLIGAVYVARKTLALRRTR